MSSPVEFFDIFASSPESRKINDNLIQALLFNESEPKLEITLDADHDQLAFINSGSETIRLIAPAGSGKTQSIVNRLLKKISEGKSAKGFLILTFDNSAKDSLLSKVSESFSKAGLSERGGPSVRTLNSFGSEIVKKFSPDAKVVLDNEPNEIIRNLLKEFRKTNPAMAEYAPNFVKARVYQDLFSLLKNSSLFSDKLIGGDKSSQKIFVDVIRTKIEPWIGTWRGTPKEKDALSKIPSMLAILFHSYNTELKDRQKIDFDDQKLLAFRFLEENPGTVGSLMSTYGEIIVDEFQDINKLDFDLIKILADKRSLVVVGDDDQAIYAFRGCSPDYIINFDERFGRKGELHILKTNYRCPKNVVEIANRLISYNNPNRVNKEQVANRSDNAHINFWHCLNAGSEAQIIARTIKKLYDTKAIKKWDYSDVAILTRLNHQCLPIQIALIMEEIPFHCDKKSNILINDLMTRLIGLMGLHLKLQKDKKHQSLEDSRLLLDCLGRFIQDWKIKKFQQAVERSGGYSEINPDEQMLPWNVNSADYKTAVQGLMRPGSPSEVVERIGRSFKNMNGIAGDLETAVNEEYLPLGEFVDIASRFKGSMQEFFEVISSLKEKVEGGLYQEKGGTGVNILTYFKCKGRQWDTVFIPGSNQKIIPQTKKDSNVEDERRIFYVAVTRATSNLFFSYVRTTVKSKVEPSQFLAELGLTEAEEKRAGVLA